MIFIKEELVNILKIDPKFLNYPEMLYDDTWYSIEQDILMKIFIRVSAFFREKVKNKIKKILFFKKTS